MTPPDTPLRVLLVEPWYGGSHRSWADGLVAHSHHQVSLVTHDASFWRWRMRGSALTLARDIEEVVDRDGRPDVLLVSDMVDLAALLGLTRRTLDGVPAVLYLHENQLAHPPSPDGAAEDLYASINWMSMAAADRAFCNSWFHREVLLAALPDFLDGAPDRSHTGFLAGVEASLGVLPVGVDLAGLIDGPRYSAFDTTGEPPLIVWNQRWDHDKNPDALFRVLRALARDGIEFRLALAGENVRSDPQEFEALRADLGDRIICEGWLEREDYLSMLLWSDVVVSTARHEFFGVAVVEAMAAGAVPLLPDRLSYPELLPAWAKDAVLYRSKLYDRLAEVLTDLPAARRRVDGLREAMRMHDWSAVAPRYDDILTEVARTYSRPDPLTD